VSPEVRARRISVNDGLIPLVKYALPQTVVKAVLYGDPYPIRGAYIQGGNLLLSYANSKEVYQALNKLDFLVVSDLWMTPTAALADVVLPVSSFLECDGVLKPEYYEIASVQQKVAQVGECRSDYDILKDLAIKTVSGGYFWDKITDILDIMVSAAGITFEEFRKIGSFQGDKLYRHYEREGFETPSGKVELYSSQLKEWGFDPLPTYYEYPETPYSDPELAKEYPLIFTSRKLQCYRHTDGRQLATLRGTHAEPVVSIHPETAKKLGITEGNWVYIETKRGRIKQKASFSNDIDPRVVELDYGWWFPERGVAADLYGWAEANVNILTSDKPPFSKEMGSPVFRGILCKVYNVD
jgi:anaerobic selenocysteine-containing dehydrogenase